MTTDHAKRTVHFRVFGRVQGVGYRDWTVQKARKLGLGGWVRNVTDGTVEGVVHGSQDALEVMIAACHAGPPLARVTEVVTQDVEGGEDFAAFQQLPTARPT